MFKETFPDYEQDLLTAIHCGYDPEFIGGIMRYLGKSLVILGMVALTVLSWGKTYYIPHIHTANDSWETNLIVDNLDSCALQGYYLTLYATDGSVVLNRKYYSLHGGQNQVVSLRPLGGVAGEVECGSDSMRFRLGYRAKESSGGGTAEFDLSDRLRDCIVFSTSNYYNQLTWGGFAVFNGSDSDVTVSVRIFTTDGKISPQLNIPAKTKVVNYFDTQFGVDLSTITSVIFITDTPALTGITISGKENDKLLFTATGTNAEGWKVKNHESVSWIRGIGRVADISLAFCRIYENYTLSTAMKTFRGGDGLPLLTVYTGYENLYPMGMACNYDYSAALAYGIDTGDSAHSYYFVAKVDPESGTLIWKTDLAEGKDPAYAGDDGFVNRICVAISGGNTAQADMRNKDGYLVKALINLNTGSVIASSQTIGDIFPTALVYDSNTSYYYNIYTWYNSTTGAYSKVTFDKNSTSSIAPVGGSSADLSALIPDGANHHVLVYAGGITNGTVRLMYNASVGAPDPQSMITSIAELPSQYVSGSVPLANFNPGSATTYVTNLTGLLGDRVAIIDYGTDDALAILSEVTTSNYRTYIFSYSEYVRTLPISVQAVTDYYGSKLLLGFRKEKPYGQSQAAKGNFPGKWIYPAPETCIQQVSLINLMNEFYQ